LMPSRIHTRCGGAGVKKSVERVGGMTGRLRWGMRAGLALISLALAATAGARAADLSKIDTIVVIYAENRSFDHLYGLFPGAEGIAQASAEQKTQLDRDGRALPYLPGSYDPSGKPRPDLQTRGLPNGPFRIDQPPVARSMAERLPNPVHNYYQNREQINGGANNKFVA